MINILDVKSTLDVDETITSLQHHAYNPYTTSFGNGDEIRISIHQQDLYLLPSDSYLYMEATIKTPEKDANGEAIEPILMVNNGPAFLFDEIRYEINGFEIDRCRNPGITTLMKGSVSYTYDDMLRMRNAGWLCHMSDENRASGNRTVNYCIPLSALFGFAEDYKRVVMNAKHELILVRSRSGVNFFHGNVDVARITIDKIQWRIPHVYVSDREKLKLLKIIDRKEIIQMNYRSWELHEYPALPINDKHIWTVKTSQKINTPRFILLGFQTNRKNNIATDNSLFDHCNISDVKVYLNSDCFPYESINSDIPAKKYGILYDMFGRFQEKYYFDRSSYTALLSYEEYLERAPLIAIDCSRQSDTIKKGLVDVRLEFQTKGNVPANTTAYCLIIHENMISYSPYSNIVSKVA